MRQVMTHRSDDRREPCGAVAWVVLALASLALVGCGRSGGPPAVEAGGPGAGVGAHGGRAAAAPATQAAEDQRGRPLDAKGVVTIVGRSAGPRLVVELARAEEERNRGLMYRRSLADDTGMLFFMPRDDDWAFWMRNTWISLDLIFIDRDWVVVGVVAAVPPLTEQLRRCGTPSRYVLELGAHEAERHGIVVGTRLALQVEGQ